jgi:uncharacterized protein GlcG (DUF336 family)
MANVVKKHSISSELAQKMVAEALAKAKEIGVTENVAILDDGGNLKAFGRMDGAPILCIEMAQNKAYTALFGVSTQVSHQGERRGCRGDRAERGAHGAKRRRLRESSPSARTRYRGAG